MPLITLTSDEQQIANDFYSPIYNFFAEKKPIPDEKAHEKLYAEYVKILKKYYPKLHKSVIYMKYFLNVRMDTFYLDQLNPLLIAYVNDPTNATKYQNLMQIISDPNLIHTGLERKFVNIDKANFKGMTNDNPKNIANIMATTEEIGASLPDAFVKTV